MKKQFTIDVPPYVTEEQMQVLANDSFDNTKAEKDEAPADDPLKRKITIELPVGVTEKQAREAIRDAALLVKLQPIVDKYIKKHPNAVNLDGMGERTRIALFGGGYQPRGSKEGKKPPKENPRLDEIEVRLNNLADRIGGLEYMGLKNKVDGLSNDVKQLMEYFKQSMDDMK